MKRFAAFSACGPRARRDRGARIRQWIGTCGLLLPCLALAMPAMAGQVVVDHVVSRADHAQAMVPITFGQVFKSGDVPHGATLAATLDGQPIALQVDVKATNMDGSMRHAVLTVQVPHLQEGEVRALQLSSVPKAPRVPGEFPGLKQLLASGYDASITFAGQGRQYTVSARELLQKAESTHACGAFNPDCVRWLSGPLVNEWVVHGSPQDAQGMPMGRLRVYFDVRVYRGSAAGTVGRVRTDIIVENADAFAPQVQPQYTATLASGTASYVSPALTQYAYTRWHKVMWWNRDKPQAYLRQDVHYIQASKAVSRYMDLKPDEGFLAGLRQSCSPLDHCDQTQRMHMAGAQPAIGPLPRWTSVYIVDPDVRAYNWMLANTDALGGYGIHYRDAATGWPVSIRKHPYVTVASWAYARHMAQGNSKEGQKYRRDLLQTCQDNAVVTDCAHGWFLTGNPNTWNAAHQPAESYVAYMVTGDYYYMSELAFAASNNELWTNPVYRGFDQGLIDDSHGQTRGKAWVLREMANAAWLLPDKYPLKAEFQADVNNSIADWNRKYTHNPKANPLALMASGATYKVNGTMRNAMAPWMHNFLTWSVGHAAELGFAGAADFRNWLARFEISMMTDWQADPRHGYCWLEASTYTLVVKDANGAWLPDFTAAYAATYPSLVGLECNSPAMVAALQALKKQPWQQGEMSGYAYSATGFPANFQVGMASAADSGLPKAHAAWELFQSRSVKPEGAHAYDNFPNFAVLPRSISP